MEDWSKYAHSPAHLAVAKRDYPTLKDIVDCLPCLAKAGEVNTEAESVAAEIDADAVSAVIDRRDVPGRETPLHLAVRLRDPICAEILMSAGADWSLQNENGWSALQEAVCTREENIAMIIARHYQPLAWAKWCRRLPRIVASAARIRDFYMEITFHFESSVIPFIGRIAPSDTYRIWKRGSNLRADMTLAGFDGFRIQRSDQTFLFLGEGYSSETSSISLPPGSLIVLAHKEKEITNALEGAGVQPSEAEVAHEVALMSQTNMYRPGIDVTQAELVPHLNWRRQERAEMVGSWKANVYDMLHVMVSVKSRRVPGAMTDEELFSMNDDGKLTNCGEHDDYNGVLTAEERMQLDSALRTGNSDGLGDDEELQVQDCHDNSSGGSFRSCESNGVPKEMKSWFGWNKKNSKGIGDDSEDSKIVKRFSKLAPDNTKQKSHDTHISSSEVQGEDTGDVKRSKDKNGKKKKKKGPLGESKRESEYKKGLRPILLLTPDFPLKTEELLPLLDILANKVKAIRRLRELLTTKLPPSTFPVKAPRHLHLVAVRCIIQYLLGTSTRRFFFPSGSEIQLNAFSDSDWAGCPDTRHSVTEIGFPQSNPTPLPADNTSAIQIATNSVYHERTKHIEVDCHYIREVVDKRVITLPHVSSDLQIADVLTKSMARQRHQFLVAIPIVPTIRVLVTFTKFEELQPVEEFSTPPSSPAHFQDAKSKQSDGSASWISWMRGSHGGQSSDSESRSFHEEIDPFHIPSDYAWVDANEKKGRMKAKKAKNRKQKKHVTTRNSDIRRQATDDVEE